MTPEIKANVEFLQEQEAKGREFVWRSELPNPNKLIYTIKHFPVLAVTNGRILLYSSKPFKGIHS